jgi:hypothetical protein
MSEFSIERCAQMVTLILRLRPNAGHGLVEAHKIRWRAVWCRNVMDRPGRIGSCRAAG